MKPIRWTVLLLAIASFSAAQSKLQYVVTTNAKPGMAPQYEALVRKVVEAAEKTGDKRTWYAFKTGAGGPSDQYTLVFPHETWAERDRWIPPTVLLRQAFGEDDATTIFGSGRVAVKNAESADTALQENLSIHLEHDGSVRKIYLVSTVKVHPHLLGDFVDALEKIRRAEAKASGSPKRTTRRTVLGDLSIFTTATGFDSGAERDEWPAFADYMSAAYSEAEISQILAKISAATVEHKTMEVRYRPDMSRPPRSN